MKHSNWWAPAAQHFFRSFFRCRLDGIPAASPEQAKAFAFCEGALSDFPSEYDFLKAFFTAKWDAKGEVVTGFSDRSNRSPVYFWRIVDRVNRRFFEVAGLLEKGDEGDEK